jgi:arylformamidase
MRFFDVSARLTGTTPTYPGNPGFDLAAVKRIASGGSSNVSALRLGTHSGTHVDAPRHFFDGRPGVDQLPLEVLIGPARVIEVAGPRRGIEASDIGESDLAGQTRILFKTGNSALWESSEFHRDYAFLDESGAKRLLDAGVRLVGIDYLSIEQYKRPGAPVHHLLLDAGVVIVEGLDLRGVPGGVYEMHCLPLAVEGADGAPARVVLRQME